MRFVRGFAGFWYDFLVGDDWKIAVCVVVALALTLAALLVGVLGTGSAAVVGGIVILAAFTVSMVIDVRKA